MSHSHIFKDNGSVVITEELGIPTNCYMYTVYKSGLKQWERRDLGAPRLVYDLRYLPKDIKVKCLLLGIEIKEDWMLP